jgi:DNA-binding PadR family transcriptional regulator
MGWRRQAWPGARGEHNAFDGACGGIGVGDIFRDTFLGFIRVHVLYHAARGRIFGLEMIEELREHGYVMSPGTMYPILHGLERAGLLRSEQAVAAGRMRRYYRITPAGRKALSKLRERIRELTEEVLEDRPPRHRDSGSGGL